MTCVNGQQGEFFSDCCAFNIFMMCDSYVQGDSCDQSYGLCGHQFSYAWETSEVSVGAHCGAIMSCPVTNQEGVNIVGLSECFVMGTFCWKAL
jgi:hypothetical protein